MQPRSQVQNVLCPLLTVQIKDIQGRGKMPVIVGGTNYYIEALLWETLMVSQETAVLIDMRTCS